MADPFDELVALAQQAQQSDTPHRALAALLPRVRALADPGADVRAAASLLAPAAELARQQDWSADMERGAEGFDNTDHARAYRQVRECLVDAGRQLARACEVLLGLR
jgi:hypothetical protein